MNRYDYYRAVMLGIVAGMGFLSIFYVFFGTSSEETPQPEPTSNFEVVAKYENCNVVQWSASNMATYKYFLHCPGN